MKKSTKKPGTGPTKPPLKPLETVAYVALPKVEPVERVVHAVVPRFEPVETTVILPELKPLQPQYVVVDATESLRRVRALRQPPRRRPLVSDKDPAFVSFVGREIRAIESAVQRIAHMTSSRPSPPALLELQHRVRDALAAYMATLADDRPV